MEKTEHLIETIQTPENVTLNFKIAEKGTRASAFLLDLFILAWGYLIPLFTISIFGSFNMLVWFLLIYFIFHISYFLYFEIKWQGVTPGKKAFNLKVIGRENVSLNLEAIVIRNLVRTIEFFIPYFVLFAMSIEMVESTAQNNYVFELLPTFFWILAFMLFPLFNPLNLRLGDILANTLVVELTKENLKLDLVEKPVNIEKPIPENEEKKPAPKDENLENVYIFKDEYLDYYGKYELQMLEEILRKPDSIHVNDIKEEVANRIYKKLMEKDWKGEIGNPNKFILAFYKFQRKFLEKKGEWGEKKGNKYSNIENED